MALEVELKFSCPDLEVVRGRLRSLNAVQGGRHFEYNELFDDPVQSLRKAGTLLRLREGQGCQLTLKRRPPGPDDSSLKIREEFETGISSCPDARMILEGLGFGRRLIYEKVRETWTLHGCTVCLDLLPFGTFVEIESDRETIFACAASLGFDRRAAIVANYHRLHQDHCRDHGLPLTDSFTFPEPLRSRLVSETSSGRAER